MTCGRKEKKREVVKKRGKSVMKMSNVGKEILKIGENDVVKGKGATEARDRNSVHIVCRENREYGAGRIEYFTIR